VKAPLITVVITAYNSAKFIKWTLQSVQSQNLKNFEVLVVGDGCTDATGEVVASLNDSRFAWENLPHTIRSNAANRAIAKARGKYIAYLDHDDLWFPWHLSSLVESLEKNGADFVFSMSASIGPQGIENPEGPPFLSLDNLRGKMPIPSTWLHRKDLIEACGPWRADIKNLRLPPDTELFLRLQKFQKKTHFCRALSVLYFPSPLWLFSKRNDNFPQEAYLTAVEKDPKKLERELLLDLTLHLAAQIPLQKKWPRIFVKLSHIYGQDRFPLFQFLRWRFLNRRKKWLSSKGLNL
jgi:glycosyltransferase involved in cell wall biosynthesis